MLFIFHLTCIVNNIFLHHTGSRLDTDTDAIYASLSVVPDLDHVELEACVTSYETLTRMIPMASVFVEPNPWPAQSSDVHGTLFSNTTQLPSLGKKLRTDQQYGRAIAAGGLWFW